MLPTPALKVCLNAPEPLTPFWGSLEKPAAGSATPFPERSQSKPQGPPWDNCYCAEMSSCSGSSLQRALSSEGGNSCLSSGRE